MINLAILGTRGIPNKYGGFERFAEVLSTELAKGDYHISVLKPVNKNESAIEFDKKIQIVPIIIPAYLPRNIQTLLYDLKSLIWFSKSGFDVALECGHSFAIWLPFFKKLAIKKIVVNVDGLEHQRSKWSFVGKFFLKTTEHLAVKYCARVISDHPVIAKYVFDKYNVLSVYIPYGAYIPTNLSMSNILYQHQLFEKKYHLLIARITPENSFELILNASKSFIYPVVVVGDISVDYAKKIVNKYNKMSNIVFLNGLYDQDILNELRFKCCAYIHGHSVGGTNPSLLEAMACGCSIVAHNNPFNNYVLKTNGLFFSTEKELSERIFYHEQKSEVDRRDIQLLNSKRLQEEYLWEHVVSKYNQVFLTLV